MILALTSRPVSSTASLPLHERQLRCPVAQMRSVIPCPSPALDPYVPIE